jgi:protocatechuate 3,4-dioxygenase beta subunit
MAAAAAVCLHAAVIRGVIVENFTSKALGRAEVILQPIGGTPGGVKTMRADSHGSFVFDSLAAGAYIVKASRKSHMAAEYGQKRWNSAGLPVILEDDTAAFLNIRLLRYSAISGTVVDENDEGLPGHEVLAYRNSKPPELIAQATRDERGIYRLHGLEPGTYVVRTAGNQSNDGSYLPTFGKETDQLEQARTVDLQPDQEADNVDVRPLPGRLYSLSVVAEKILPGADVAITLASQMGRKTIKASAYRFAALPPGDYELFAQVPADPGPGESIQGGYQRIFLGRDMIVSLLLRSGSAVTVSGAPANASGDIRIRRADLAGAGPAFMLPVLNGAATIPAGRWEVMLQPPSGYYVSRFSGPGLSPASAFGFGRPDGWEEVLSPGTAGRFTLSGGPSAIRGVVKSSDDPVSGAPVYLEAYDPTAGKRVAELRTAISDMHGQYRLDGLAPGTYRILSTFEYLFPDMETMGVSGAQLVTVDAHSELSRDLDLYLIR